MIHCYSRHRSKKTCLRSELFCFPRLQWHASCIHNKRWNTIIIVKKTNLYSYIKVIFLSQMLGRRTNWSCCLYHLNTCTYKINLDYRKTNSSLIGIENLLNGSCVGADIHYLQISFITLYFYVSLIAHLAERILN